MQVHFKRQVLMEWIIRNKTSPSAFAREAKISGGYVAQLLNGKRQPSGQVRQKLLSASGLPFEALFQIVELREEADDAITPR